MTGEELHRRFTKQGLWRSVHPADKARWDRLAAEVVPVSEVVELRAALNQIVSEYTPYACGQAWRRRVSRGSEAA